MTTSLTPEEVELLLWEIYDREVDFWMECGNLFDDAAPWGGETEDVEEYSSPEDCAGWRERDFR